MRHKIDKILRKIVISILNRITNGHDLIRCLCHCGAVISIRSNSRQYVASVEADDLSIEIDVKYNPDGELLEMFNEESKRRQLLNTRL